MGRVLSRSKFIDSKENFKKKKRNFGKRVSALTLMGKIIQNGMHAIGDIIIYGIIGAIFIQTK